MLKVKETEVIKYYAELLLPCLIDMTAKRGYIDQTAMLKKFGLSSEWLVKIRDYLSAQGFIENSALKMTTEKQSQKRDHAVSEFKKNKIDRKWYMFWHKLFDPRR